MCGCLQINDTIHLIRHCVLDLHRATSWHSEIVECDRRAVPETAGLAAAAASAAVGVACGAAALGADRVARVCALEFRATLRGTEVAFEAVVVGAILRIQCFAAFDRHAETILEHTNAFADTGAGVTDEVARIAAGAVTEAAVAIAT